MRFLVDNALSHHVARGLNDAGHNARHIRDYGLEAAKDDIVFDLAGDEERVLISADTDFGRILATRDSSSPSVILFRWPALRQPADQVKVLLSNLTAISEDLEQGSMVVIQESRIRVRRLPLGGSETE